MTKHNIHLISSKLDTDTVAVIIRSQLWHMFSYDNSGAMPTINGTLYLDEAVNIDDILSQICLEAFGGSFQAFVCLYDGHVHHFSEESYQAFLDNFHDAISSDGWYHKVVEHEEMPF